MNSEESVIYDVRCCLSLIVIGRTETDVINGWNKLKKLQEDGIITRLTNCEDILRDVLRGQIINVHEVPIIMTWFANHFADNIFDIGLITVDIAEFLRNAKIEHMSHLTMILQVLLDQKFYLSESVNHTKLCEAIVITLSTFPMPRNPKQISEFMENATKIQNFLATICMHTKNRENCNLMFTCLEALYRIISDTKRKSEPSPGLGAVLQLVEPSVIPRAVQWILFESCSDQELAQALKTLCTWLSLWLGDRLGIWIMEFIQGLEGQDKCAILLEVTDATITSMFLSLLTPAIRPNTSPIVFYILKRQGTPAIVQKIIRKMPLFMSYLIKEASPSSKVCIQNIVDIMHAIMERFPGHQINTILQKSLPPTPLPQTHVVREICQGSLWKDETRDIEPVVEISRVVSGKVGLSNLGNTCYMNSVLQALVMTRQFCHEVLNSKISNEMCDQIILRKLQNLFALLLYSKRICLAPTEVLLASRPAYFLPGQQQDSSEFLCHLLDVLHEQEKAINVNNGTNDSTSNLKCKAEKQSNNLMMTEQLGTTIKRWTTEEDLTGGIALQRKTQSLADFTQGEDLSHMQQLSDSHSDSTDSGIQSVGGEETVMQTSLVHRVLGGESKITYQCAQCDTSSHNTDKFRDLQLCFPEEIQENQEVSVQDLINYYLTPEKLTGENKYRCDKCTKLCDAQRIIKILQAPAHLILTLKHFRYDFGSRLRNKLRHKVTYNETIQLPVSTLPCTIAETYQLYAAVVHSGYSMDYGHYFTYACDSKQNWYKFNDSYVSLTTLDGFKNLKPPDTPYILFYEKLLSADEIYEEDKPELSTLSKRLQELVTNDTTAYIQELRHQAEKSHRNRQTTTFLRRNDNNSDDENPPPSSCRGAVNIPANRFLY